jgi:hypothetical protein
MQDALPVHYNTMERTIAPPSKIIYINRTISIFRPRLLTEHKQVVTHGA